jgi:predicted metal-binding transcription factor (methanogenesis marker protein 9)
MCWFNCKYLNDIWLCREAHEGPRNFIFVINSVNPYNPWLKKFRKLRFDPKDFMDEKKENERRQSTA